MTLPCHATDVLGLRGRLFSGETHDRPRYLKQSGHPATSTGNESTRLRRIAERLPLWMLGARAGRDRIACRDSAEARWSTPGPSPGPEQPRTWDTSGPATGRFPRPCRHRWPGWRCKRRDHDGQQARSRACCQCSVSEQPGVERLLPPGTDGLRQGLPWVERRPDSEGHGVRAAQGQGRHARAGGAARLAARSVHLGLGEYLWRSVWGRAQLSTCQVRGRRDRARHAGEHA